MDAPNMTEVLPIEDKNLAAIQLVLTEVVLPVPAEPSKATLDPPDEPPLVVPPETTAIEPPLARGRLESCPDASPLLLVEPPEPALIEPVLEQPQAMIITVSNPVDCAILVTRIMVPFSCGQILRPVIRWSTILTFGSNRPARSRRGDYSRVT